MEDFITVNDVEVVTEAPQEPEAPISEVTEEVTPEVEVAKPQSAEDNAKFAEIRRKYEAEKKQILAELEAERAAKVERVNEVVQTAFRGAINPYTDKPIETEEDYEEYQKMYREDALEKLGYSKDFIEKEIARNPIIKEAQKIIEAQKSYQSKLAFDARLLEITKLNPEIKTIDDLQKIPEIEEFNEYVLQKHYDIVDAYKLVSHDAKKKISTAEQKEHLIRTGGNGGGGLEIEIPSSEIAYYKDSFPKDTPAQLRARYNRVLKRQGE